MEGHLGSLRVLDSYEEILFLCQCLSLSRQLAPLAPSLPTGSWCQETFCGRVGGGLAVLGQQPACRLGLNERAQGQRVNVGCHGLDSAHPGNMSSLYWQIPARM